MDATALRVEGIRISLEATRWVADLEARRHVAVLAVGLTVLGTGILAGIAREIEPRWSTMLAVACPVVVLTQLRALANLKRAMEWNGEEARLAIDTLIRREEELHVDETQSHP